MRSIIAVQVREPVKVEADKWPARIVGCREEQRATGRESALDAALRVRETSSSLTFPNIVVVGLVGSYV